MYERAPHDLDVKAVREVGHALAGLDLSDQTPVFKVNGKPVPKGLWNRVWATHSVRDKLGGQPVSEQEVRNWVIRLVAFRQKAEELGLVTTREQVLASIERTRADIASDAHSSQVNEEIKALAESLGLSVDEYWRSQLVFQQEEDFLIVQNLSNYFAKSVNRLPGELEAAFALRQRNEVRQAMDALATDAKVENTP